MGRCLILSHQWESICDTKKARSGACAAGLGSEPLAWRPLKTLAAAAALLGQRPRQGSSLGRAQVIAAPGPAIIAKSSVVVDDDNSVVAKTSTESEGTGRNHAGKEFTRLGTGSSAKNQRKSEQNSFHGITFGSP